MASRAELKLRSLRAEREFFYNWDGQKQFLLEFSFQIMKDWKISSEDAIKVAHDFMEVYREQVIVPTTKIYFNK